MHDGMIFFRNIAVLFVSNQYYTYYYIIYE